MYVFFFKQKTAYEMRISDWSSDVCSSDLSAIARGWMHMRTWGIWALVVAALCALAALSWWWAVGSQSRVDPEFTQAFIDLDRKSTRLNPVTNAHLVCRLLLEKKKQTE